VYGNLVRTPQKNNPHRYRDRSINNFQITVFRYVRTVHVDNIARAKCRLPDPFDAEIKFPLHSSKPGKLRDSISFFIETHTKNKSECIKLLWVFKVGHNWLSNSSCLLGNWTQHLEALSGWYYNRWLCVWSSETCSRTISRCTISRVSKTEISSDTDAISIQCSSCHTPNNTTPDLCCRGLTARFLVWWRRGRPTRCSWRLWIL